MDSDYRRKLLRNLTTQLIKYGKIKTTLHRAKDLRRLADKMVAYAHKATPAAKGKIEAFLFEKSVCQKLLTEMPNRFKTASGGIGYYLCDYAHVNLRLHAYCTLGTEEGR